MRIDWIKQFDDIPLSRDEWNDIVQHNHTNTVFQTYEWLESWWNSLGKHNQLVFLIAYDNEQIIGFAPLMMVNSLYGSKSLHFAGDTNADYCDFVINGNHMKIISAFLEFLDKNISAWNSMTLINIPSNSITLSCLQTICHEKKYNIAIKQRIKAPALLINNQSEALATVNKYSVLRHLRKIEKHGKLEFINISNKNDIMMYLDTFFDQHVDRYRIKNMVSQFTNTDNRQLYIDMVNNFDHTGWILFSVLLLNGEPVAFHFGFNYNNKIIWYKPSFNPAYRDFSPGTLMLKFLVEHAVDTKMTELDFTIGDESFKSRFSNCVRHNDNVVIYRSKVLCIGLSFLRKVLHRLYHSSIFSKK